MFKAVREMSAVRRFFCAAVLLTISALICLVAFSSGTTGSAATEPAGELAFEVVEMSVDAVEKSYLDGRRKELDDPASEVIAGSAGIKRNALTRSTFRKAAQKAAQLGGYARETVAANQMSYNDYYTLLQIVEAEATGGDRRSKQLIANVVLNRVRDEHFPDTVYDVVWESVDGNAQFSPTVDGRIESCEITRDTIEAVDDVLAGADESEGALFFLARSASESSSVAWFDSRLDRLFEYGGHEFYTFSET